MAFKVRVDKNQKEIVEFLRSKGAVVIHIHIVKNAFDIIVCHNGKVFLVEIKDGVKKLTDGEIACRDSVESVGVKYWIIRNIEEAANMIEK